MRGGAPKRNVSRPEGRRNLSTVAEASGIPKEYRATKYEKGDGLDRMWVEKREVTDRTCPCCGAEGHVNGHRSALPGELERAARAATRQGVCPIRLLGEYFTLLAAACRPERRVVPLADW